MTRSDMQPGLDF